ncbi:hypothetical protein QUB70_31775 [Microcoleus sp. A003_D6]|uniref:hypothetical protein n=1 Tax=Microcoleus sp. A003_D6 TaxID=3055266 RepID=UPI002FD41F5D
MLTTFTAYSIIQVFSVKFNKLAYRNMLPILLGAIERNQGIEPAVKIIPFVL